MGTVRRDDDLSSCISAPLTRIGFPTALFLRTFYSGSRRVSRGILRFLITRATFLPNRYRRTLTPLTMGCNIFLNLAGLLPHRPQKDPRAKEVDAGEV